MSTKRKFYAEVRRATFFMCAAVSDCGHGLGGDMFLRRRGRTPLRGKYQRISDLGSSLGANGHCNNTRSPRRLGARVLSPIAPTVISIGNW